MDMVNIVLLLVSIITLIVTVPWYFWRHSRKKEYVDKEWSEDKKRKPVAARITMIVLFVGWLAASMQMYWDTVLEQQKSIPAYATWLVQQMDEQRMARLNAKWADSTCSEIWVREDSLPLAVRGDSVTASLFFLNATEDFDVTVKRIRVDFLDAKGNTCATKFAYGPEDMQLWETRIQRALYVFDSPKEAQTIARTKTTVESVEITWGW